MSDTEGDFNVPRWIIEEGQRRNVDHVATVQLRHLICNNEKESVFVGLFEGNQAKFYLSRSPESMYLANLHQKLLNLSSVSCFFDRPLAFHQDEHGSVLIMPQLGMSLEDYLEQPQQTLDDRQDIVSQSAAILGMMQQTGLIYPPMTTMSEVFRVVVCEGTLVVKLNALHLESDLELNNLDAKKHWESSASCFLTGTTNSTAALIHSNHMLIASLFKKLRCCTTEERCPSWKEIASASRVRSSKEDIEVYFCISNFLHVTKPPIGDKLKEKLKSLQGLVLPEDWYHKLFKLNPGVCRAMKGRHVQLTNPTRTGNRILDGDSIISLIRAPRNLWSHVLDMIVLGIDDVLEPGSDSHAKLWKLVCPNLVDVLLVEGTRNANARRYLPHIFNDLPKKLPSIRKLESEVAVERHLGAVHRSTTIRHVLSIGRSRQPNTGAGVLVARARRDIQAPRVKTSRVKRILAVSRKSQSLPGSPSSPLSDPCLHPNKLTRRYSPESEVEERQEPNRDHL